MTIFGKFCQWFTIIIDMPIVFGLLGLSYTILLMIYNNKTQMEEIKGVTLAGSSADVQFRYPCLGTQQTFQDGISPNKYDMLWPNNITSVMGSNMFYWLIPFYIPEPKGRCLYFPQIPKLPLQNLNEY